MCYHLSISNNMEPIEIKLFRARIGKAIKRLRTDEGISAAFLAKILGTTQPTISRIECGAASITAEKLCFLAKSFNRPISYFIGEQSPIVNSESDVIKAGLVFYGAKAIKCKRTIDVNGHYRTYSDFLNAALSEVDDPRTAAAVATTLYKQALDNNLNITKLLSTIQHERLLTNLCAIIKLINDARSNILRPEKEKERVISKLLEMSSQAGESVDITKATVAEISYSYVGRFINSCLSI